MRSASSIVLIGVLGLARSAAAAHGVDACLDAYEQSQVLRRDEHLTAAREKLLVCSRDPCPKALQGDCQAWLGQVDNELPSVVLAARDAQGHDLVDVRVAVDGAPLVSNLDARALTLDPGPHVFTFVSRDGETKEERVLLREGEKARRVAVELSRRADPPPSAPASPPLPAPSQTTRWPAYVVGAAGVVALGFFSYFGLTGRSDYMACESGCAPDRVDAIQQKFVAADVSLGLSVIALAASAYLFLTNPPANAQRAQSSNVTTDPNRRAPGLKLNLYF